jgi:hypothetical protein
LRRQALLVRVKRILEGKGIDEATVEKTYEFIKSSGHYPARMPAPYLAIAIELIEMDRINPGRVQIHISPKPAKHAVGKPSVTFAVLAPDWPGLLNSCTGTLHEKGFNVAFCEAIVIDEPDKRLGMVFMEIEVADKEEFNHLLSVEDEIRESLIRAAAAETGKDELLILETRKAEQYSLVAEELKKIAAPADYPAFFGRKGEAVRFFAARTFAYLTERSPQDLAEQIHTNFTFIRKVREDGKIYAKAGNVATPAGDLTGVSVAAYGHDLSMGNVFRLIDEVAPGYQRKYDKAFITGEGINIMRIEFVDAKGMPLTHDHRVELTQKILSFKEAPVCDRLSPGLELVGRKICPAMLEEEREIRLPQVYMHPHSRSNIKVILVVSGKDKGRAFNCIEEISKVKGLEAAMPDPPSIVHPSNGHSGDYQEVAIIDVWVNFEAFFGSPRGPYDDELILVKIEDALRKAKDIGPRLRIFDKTGRQLRRARTERIMGMAGEKGLSPELTRQILARFGDRLVISPTVSDDEVFDQVEAGVEAVMRWKESGSSKPQVAWRNIEMSSGGRGSSYTLYAIVEKLGSPDLSEVVTVLSESGPESSVIYDGDDYRLLLYRLAHQGRSLEATEIDQITARLSKILNLP